MDFDLNQEQRMLQQSAGVFLKKEFPKPVVRELAETEEGYSPGLWRKMAELGWVGLMIPEEYGGSACSFLDLTVLLEEMGYNLCPGPFFSTAVLGVTPLLAAGSEEQKSRILPRIASGDLLATLAVTEASASYDAAAVRLEALPRGDGYLLSGMKLFVPDAHVANVIICAARTGDSENPEEGITLFLVEADAAGVTRTPLRTVSHDKQSEVVFEGVSVPAANVVGTVGEGWPIVQDTLRQAAVARCAEMIGGAHAARDMALEYAHERIQFNRPIGSFQAVQHHFANMWLDWNGARNLTYRAAWRLSEGLPAEMEVAAAKAHTGAAYRKATALCHEVFGAIGFTMEHDLHLYHRRAAAADLSFGNADVHLETVARSLGL